MLSKFGLIVCVFIVSVMFSEPYAKRATCLPNVFLVECWARQLIYSTLVELIRIWFFMHF
jgi:hypothetical protein